MSKGSFRSGGTRVSDLAGIADRKPVNQQATRGLKGKKIAPGFCPVDISIGQLECQFDNLFGTGHGAGKRKSGKR